MEYTAARKPSADEMRNGVYRCRSWYVRRIIISAVDTQSDIPAEGILLGSPSMFLGQPGRVSGAVHEDFVFLFEEMDVDAETLDVVSQDRRQGRCESSWRMRPTLCTFAQFHCICWHPVSV
jgi:hypothetical protein